MNPKHPHSAYADGEPFILSLLQRVEQTGSGWKALCPAHPDQNPSLTIGIGDAGRVLLHCFAGCATQDVLQSLGLEMSALNGDATHRDSTTSTAGRNERGWASYRD